MVKDRMLSKSQINCFLQCPHRWKLRYVDGREGKKAEEMIRGIKIHEQIEKFYDNIEIKITNNKQETND